MMELSLERRMREADVLTPKNPQQPEGDVLPALFHYFANDPIQIDAH
jgi:hypothetical protein